MRGARRRAGFAGGLVLALGAAALLGVALGRSAIGEINPVHYRDPRPPRVAGAPTPAAPDAFAQAYGWDRGAAARAADCGGDCDRPRARDAIGFGPDELPRPAADRNPEVAELPPWPPGAVDDGSGPAEQYAHFPIETKPAEASPAAALAIPKPDGGAGN